MHKTIAVTGIKTSGLAEGEFIGYASTFGNVDHQGDRVVKGAFTKSLETDTVVPIAWEHKTSDPRNLVGEIKSARETDEGLEIHAKLDLDTEFGAAAYRAVKARRVGSLSIGYGVRNSVKASDGVNELTDLDLIEVSLVSRPANDRATITASKSATPPTKLLKARAKAAALAADDPDAAEDDKPDESDMTVGERLVAALERATEAANELIETAEEEGRDLTDAEAAEVDKAQGKAKGYRQEIEKWAAMSPTDRYGLQYIADVMHGTKGADVFHTAWGAQDAAHTSDRFATFAAPFKTKASNTKNHKETHVDTLTKDKFLTFGAGRKAMASAIATKMTGGHRAPGDETATGIGTKALTSSGQIVSDVPIRPDVIPVGRPATSILDVLPTVTRTTPTWRYLRQNSRTSAAAPVAPGALKPESVYGVETIDGEATVIAHLSEPVDKFVLQDAPGLQRFLADEMVYGLDRAVQAQVLTGDGLGANLTGILSTSGVSVQAFATNVLTSVRKAITQAESLGYEPSVLVISPADWEALELLATTDAALSYRGVPLDQGERKIWGLRAVLATGLPAKTAIVLDPAAVSIDIVGPAVQVEWSTESGELFARNQVQVRVEGRFGISVYQPTAVFKVATAAA
ncbi:HK97 family phage prohead protease [Gordonia sp. SL306]|uniref:HK97 family phage prohead protease n=1 Tax=Gordonia sp. SL306 TaxID=2995145 RepID=UPI00226F1C55|nr:HK97 family phage prohead protease [Gordonia sp. SL306]WAC58233.1 HK97 family phage prohead protease [Gordonia sp. SL306]